MAVQRQNLQRRGGPAVAVALTAALATAAVVGGCDTPASPTAPPTDRVDRSGLAPLQLSEFEPASDEQLALRAAADEALRAGDEDTAVTALLTLARSAPRSEPVAVGALLLAQLYHQRGDFERSLGVLDDLVAWAPASAELEFVRASTLLDLDRPTQAVDALERAIHIEPDYIRAYPMLVAVQESIGQGQAAEETLLAMERRVQRMGRELDGDATTARKRDILARLRIGFAHAEVARAAANALDDDDPAIVAAALETLSRVATVDVLGALRTVAGNEGPNAEAAARVIAALPVGPR